MKLNLNFYEKDVDIKNLNDESKSIISNCDSFNYEQNCNSDISNDTFNCITECNRNIIEWYDFSKTDSVLEINMTNGIITNFLCDKFSQVTSVCFKKEDFELLKNKLEKLDNLEVIVGNMDKIVFDKKFDYILFAGGIEELIKFYSKDLKSFVLYMKELLNKDGKLLLCFDNSFSVKTLVGGKNFYENESSLSFETIKNTIKECDLNYKVYYPLPDYKICNVIYSDEFLPLTSSSKLMYNLNYIKNSIVIGNEHSYLKNFIEQGIFDKVTNSYFIEIGELEEKHSQPRFVSFNNLRKKEHRLTTKMYKEFVIKTPQGNGSDIHIKNITKYIKDFSSLGLNSLDSSDGNEIISKFCNLTTFNKIIINDILNGKIDETFKMLDLWRDKVLSKLTVNKNIDDISSQNIFVRFNINLDQEKLSNFKFTEFGFYDLVFENAFFDGKEFLFYDQEWKEKNVPIEFILYRAINNIYLYCEKLEEILPKENVLKHFNIENYVEIFDKLERSIQKYILDELRLLVYKNSTNHKINLEREIKDKKELLEVCTSQNTKYDRLYNEYLSIKEKCEYMEKELVSIRDSRSYKIMQSLNFKSKRGN